MLTPPLTFGLSRGPNPYITKVGARFLPASVGGEVGVDSFSDGGTEGCRGSFGDSEQFKESVRILRLASISPITFNMAENQ